MGTGDIKLGKWKCGGEIICKTSRKSHAVAMARFSSNWQGGNERKLQVCNIVTLPAE